MNQHYSLLDHASHVNISGGMFQMGPSVADAARDRLEKHVALNALPDSGAMYLGPKCYPETRSAINGKIQRWIRQKDDLNVKLMWLHGGAGAGKSAIMRTTALGGPSKQDQENDSGTPHVLASFFFFKNDATRNTARALIPTLAMQLCDAHPAARDVILQMIADKREAIFTKTVWVQARDLLSKPLSVLEGWLSDADQVQDESQPGRVFIIDGLDECSDLDAQAEIIDTISRLIQDLPIRVLLASRPEEMISSTIRNSPILRDIYAEISLSDDPDSDNDIRLFLEESLKKIGERRRSQPFCFLPTPWPTKRDITELVAKSSRHFIYASTAAKYIASGEERPDVALRVILGLQAPRTGQPFAELDTLYRHILGKARFRKEVLHIIAFCLFTSLEVSMNSAHLVLRYSLDDIYHFLSDMRALVTIDDSLRVYLLHKSFQDFLCDEGRARDFYIGTRHQFHRDHVVHYFAVLDLVGMPSCKCPNKDMAQNLCQVLEDIATGITASSLSDIVSALIQHHPPRLVHKMLENYGAHSVHRTSTTYLKGIVQYALQELLTTKPPPPDDDDLSDIIIPLLLAGFDLDILRDIHTNAGGLFDPGIFAILSFAQHQKPTCCAHNPFDVLQRIREETLHAEEDLASATLKMLEWVTVQTTNPRKGESGRRFNHGRRLAGNLLKAVTFVLPKVRPCDNIAQRAMRELRTPADGETVVDAYSDKEVRQFRDRARNAVSQYWQRTLKNLVETYQEIRSNKCPPLGDLSDIIIPLLLFGFSVYTLRDIHTDAGATGACSSTFRTLSLALHHPPPSHDLDSVLHQIRNENPRAEEDLAFATLTILQWVTVEERLDKNRSRDRYRLKSGRRLAGNLLKAVTFVLPRVRRCWYIALSAMRPLRIPADVEAMEGAYSDEEMHELIEKARSAMDDYWQHLLWRDTRFGRAYSREDELLLQALSLYD